MKDKKKEKHNNKDKKKITEEAVNYEIKAEENLQGWKRALADYENIKRDLDKTKEENRDRIRIDLAHQLLPIIDNFEQAVHHVPDLESCGEDLKKKLDVWLQGVVFIKQQFEVAMQELGIERINIGDKIDPYLHEVIGEADETKEISSGWKIGDQVLRPVKLVIKKDNN